MPPIYTFHFKNKTNTSVIMTVTAYDLYLATKKLRTVVLDVNDWDELEENC